nr:uncharacterized protein CTRU02_05016 [Colletotrichum truncatum]KAF6794815.1 hypothetical protein CTRU02_05016 [Colletotrichum truncatum]
MPVRQHVRPRPWISVRVLTCQNPRPDGRRHQSLHPWGYTKEFKQGLESCWRMVMNCMCEGHAIYWLGHSSPFTVVARALFPTPPFMSTILQQS